MNQAKFPRGSEWRKWDLHFHTPASFDYQYKGATNEEVVQGLIDANVGAVAITDHHTIDVSRIKAMQMLAADALTIFPGIELRTELGGSSLVHMIGIFPEDCDLTDIWTKLSAKLDITAADVQRKGDDRVYVDFRDAAKLIRELNGVVTVHAGHKANTIEGIKNSELYKQQLKTDLLRESVDILEVGKASDCRDYDRIVFPHIGKRMPVCVFSDNHDIRSYAPQDTCWVKANPTFHGLRQILNEPDERVYVGDVPPSNARAVQRSTRIIKELEIRKIDGSALKEKWFDATIPLNSELVAVIGNKGSGKSALSDILGLLGNTPRFDSFSFLSNLKFRKSKNNKSKQFRASLTWVDGTVDPVLSLDTNPSVGAVEKVKYIPQSYLEAICNEVGEGKGGRFYDELQQVIFSHVPTSEQLGFETLDELLESRTEETNKAISQLVSSLDETNTLIVTAEDKLLPHHKKAIESQLEEKNRELTAHLATPPTEVVKPDEDPAAQEETKAAAAEIESLNTSLAAVEAELTALRSDDAVAARRRSLVEKLLGKIRNLERAVSGFFSESAAEFEELGLKATDVVKFEADVVSVEELLTTLAEQRTVFAKKLDASALDGPERNRLSIIAKVAEMHVKLSARDREYQEYLQTRKEFDATTARIVGSEELPGSIKYLEQQLSDLTDVPSLLHELRSRRERNLLDIFQEKQRLRAYFENYYGAVQEFLKQHPLAATEQFRLTFNVSMAEAGFASGFLGRINRRKSGPFMGDEEGSAEMKAMLESADFESPSGALLFATNVLERMKVRDGKPLSLIEQLRQGSSAKDLYNYLFSLSYLSPIYSLRWDGKDLEQLSPGERGNLLLIFYLLIDRDDIPLVIDQPEENLDNQTVFKTLVPCIKDAKRRRQIVLVTHNPNLAVVCDAEQIICADMQKNQENEVTYVTGAIEDPEINRRIVDVLEGTRPAFDKRDDKYLSAQ